jgi:hypothetical protein
MSPTMVFVHLNSPIPLYLRMNIVATMKKFPNTKVVLIHNSEKKVRIHSNLWLFQYEPGTESKSIENSLSHPKEFRNNFWFSAIQRFDALRFYIEKTQESIIHLESDVIVSRDFPIESFVEGDIKIAYPVVANNRGVASTLFIRNSETAEQLIRFTGQISSLNSKTTDMEILADFYKENPKFTTALIFGPNNIDAYHQSFPMGSVQPSAEIFDGIFDGNDIGMYLFGTNPYNARGVSQVRTSIQGNYARINQWGFEFDESREFINLKFEGVVTPIYSLHATSKQLTLFHHHTQNFQIRRFLKKYKSGDKKVFLFVTLTMTGRKIRKLWKR